MAITISITDQITPVLNRLKVGARTQVNPVIGEAVTLLFQKHLRGLPSNKKGYPTTHFWQRAVRATFPTVLADGVMITISQQGIRQRYYGGDIKPGAGKSYLTLPANPAAYGHTAREFNLKFAFVDDGGFQRPALVAQRSVASQVTQTRNGKFKHTADELGVVVFYWLVRQVHQEPNPDILPDEATISATVVSTVRSVVARVIARGGAK